jgi:hypothetical protein
MIQFKFRLHKIIGKWVNDDVDILPGLKFRTGSDANESKTVTTTMLCLVWLKWGIGISLTKITFKS